MTSMRRLPVPTWSRVFDRSVSAEFGEEEFIKLQRQRDKILKVLDGAIQEYVDQNTTDNEQEFPSRNRLSGEYYLGDEAYWVNDKSWFADVGPNVSTALAS